MHSRPTSKPPARLCSVQELGADYLLTVKTNQSALLQLVEQRLEAGKEIREIGNDLN